jgi:hypothetical protein
MFNSIFNVAVSANAPERVKETRVRKLCACKHEFKSHGGYLSTQFHIQNNNFLDTFTSCENAGCKGKIFIKCVCCPVTEELSGGHFSWQNPILCRKPAISNAEIRRNMDTHVKGQLKAGDKQQNGGAHAFWDAIHQLAQDGTALDDEKRRELEAAVLKLAHRFKTWMERFQHILTSTDHDNRDHNDTKLKFQNAQKVLFLMGEKYNCHWLTRGKKRYRSPTDPSASPTAPTADTDAALMPREYAEAIAALVQLTNSPPREADGNDSADAPGAEGTEGVAGAAVRVDKASLAFMCD